MGIYFRCWLISQGKEVFYHVKSNPTLIDEVIEGKDMSLKGFGMWR
jgi:hypothetical protein